MPRAFSTSLAYGDAEIIAANSNTERIVLLSILMSRKIRLIAIDTPPSHVT